MNDQIHLSPATDFHTIITIEHPAFREEYDVHDTAVEEIARILALQRGVIWPLPTTTCGGSFVTHSPLTSDCAGWALGNFALEAEIRQQAEDLLKKAFGGEKSK